MKGKYIFPIRIMDSIKIENKERLLVEKLVQAGFSERECCKIKKGGYVLLDFGREICGEVVITTQTVSEEKAMCRIVFGESVMEALSTIGVKNATNDHSVRDMQVQLVNMSNMRFGNTGFRFVKVEALNADLTIKNICAEADIKDIEYKGSFECNDELINKIWKTGAYTVHLNMHDYVWDGIKRDRLVWIGDMHPEVSTIKAVFGYDDSVPNSLDFAKSETPPDQWMNGIPTYSMWWIMIHYDWYMQNGNIEYLKEQQEYMTKLVRCASEWIKEKTPREGMDLFVDWNSFGFSDISEPGVYAIFALGMEAAEKIFNILEDEDMARLCKKTREAILQMKHNVPDYKQIAALCALAGIKQETVINEEILSRNPIDGLSTFLGYYTLNARAKAGDMTGALDVIRRYWGAMLKLGATTFWEDFDISWTENAAGIDEIVPEGKTDIHGDFGKHCYKQFRHSLCHGWASGPTAFLSQKVLGIEILEPGCKKVRINPDLGDLEWVKGTYPTPFGNIEVEHRKDNDEVISKIAVPSGIQLV